jgi:hypothetical protein
MGHEVVFLNELKTPTDDVLRESLVSNMLVWVHSHGFENRGTITMGEVLKRLKKKGVPTVGYHLDLYMGLKRWTEYQTHDYFNVEYFFTVDKLMADWLNENTSTKGYFLEAGVFDQECVMLPPQQVQYDIVFVGSRNYHTEWPYRPQLVDWLRENAGRRFVHVGPDGAGVYRGFQLNQVLSNAKITVGDTLNIGFNYPYYSSDRFFEVMGRGGFLIYPKIEGFAPEYKDGVHLAYYKHGDLDDLRDRLEYYLRHDDEREKIRLAGFELTKNKNTYKQRWQVILDTVANG